MVIIITTLHYYISNFECDAGQPNMGVFDSQIVITALFKMRDNNNSTKGDAHAVS